MGQNFKHVVRKRKKKIREGKNPKIFIVSDLRVGDA